MDMNSDNAGLPSDAAVLGFGRSAENLTFTGANIDLTGTAGGTALNFAFSMPRDGTITSIAAYFSNTNSNVSAGASSTITGQLYSAPTPNNIFTPIAGASVTLSPAITNAAVLGTISKGITTGLSIAVTAQTGLLMVFTITTSGATNPDAVAGYISAGVTIT
jgi:BclB C-terminal domain-containing protein